MGRIKANKKQRITARCLSEKGMAVMLDGGELVGAEVDHGFSASGGSDSSSNRRM